MYISWFQNECFNVFLDNLFEKFFIWKKVRKHGASIAKSSYRIRSCSHTHTQEDDLFRLGRECREARLLWLLALCCGNEIPGWSSLHLSWSPVLDAPTMTALPMSRRHVSTDTFFQCGIFDPKNLAKMWSNFEIDNNDGAIVIHILKPSTYF